MTRNEILQAVIDGKEIQILCGTWSDMSHDDVLKWLGGGYATNCFRIKQNTITVNGWEIVAGETKPLEHGTDYFTVVLDHKDYYHTATFTDHRIDITRLNRGIVHLTKDNAIVHAKAMLGIDPNTPNEE